jgi:hypothetical protein
MFAVFSGTRPGLEWQARRSNDQRWFKIHIARQLFLGLNAHLQNGDSNPWSKTLVWYRYLVNVK